MATATTSTVALGAMNRASIPPVRQCERGSTAQASPGRRCSRAAALLRRAGAVAVASALAGAHGHAIEVRECITPSGNLRFFVEHWHDDLESPAEASTMQIQQQVTGQSASTTTEWAQGMFNNKNIDQEHNGWGCVNDETPQLVTSTDGNGQDSTCSDHPNVVDHINESGSLATNDWVYYERSLTCHVEITYTLLEGDTVYLMDGCSGEYLYSDGSGKVLAGFDLYPAVIGPHTFEDQSPPTPKVNGEDLPLTLTIETDDYAADDAIVTFVLSAEDDCDASPDVTTSPYLSGDAFPVGTTTITVTATDEDGNQGVGYLTIVVERPENPSSQPSTQPSLQPSLVPSTVPSELPSSMPSVQPSLAHSTVPSELPSSMPSAQPSLVPSAVPSELPSSMPSVQPSLIPSTMPSQLPSQQPSMLPSARPSNQPSIDCPENHEWTFTGSKYECICVEGSPPVPKVNGSDLPLTLEIETDSDLDDVAVATFTLSAEDDCDATPDVITSPYSSESGPYLNGDAFPVGTTTIAVTATDDHENSSTGYLTIVVTRPINPSSQPSTQPSLQPSARPSTEPSSQPSLVPSTVPSQLPSSIPSSQPSLVPSSMPSTVPSEMPSSLPSVQPSLATSAMPSQLPSQQPSTLPSAQPSNQPSIDCPTNAEWTFTGNSYECVCVDGYEADGDVCSDIDECTSKTDECHENAQCTNTVGGYTCACNDGYQGDGISCTDVNECLDDTLNDCDKGGATCTNTDGSFTCACNEGYTGDGTVCADIDECSEGSNCDTNAQCVNTVGSYTCTCNDGYDGDGFSCSDVNECLDDALNDCDANAKCFNTDSSYTCACESGFIGDGYSCTDINECAEGDPCHADAQCANTLGSFTCICNDGYEGTGFACSDINECARGLDNCHVTARCTNTIGSFECACPTGWVGNPISGCETVSPTASPTWQPSSLPSMQPSITIQEIVHEGSISVSQDMCAMSDAQVETYGNTVLGSIQQVTNCYDETGCVAELTNVCGTASSRRRLRSSPRRLQTSAYQVDYKVTQSFTCEYASCSSPSDSAITETIVDGIIAPIEASLAGNEFLEILSTNLLNTGSFSAAITACLSVWGVISVRDFLVNPAGGEDTTGTPGLFYPDWENHLGTCLQDGNQPLYMELDPNTWLFDNLEACCDRYYSGWNKNKCMNQKGSGLWYVSHQLEKCVTDCNEDKGNTCGGLAHDVSDELFADPRSCCEKELPWRFLDFCEAESLQSTCYAGSGKYYRGDYLESTGSKVCVKDCDANLTGDNTCGGLVEDTYIDLYDTPEECCSTEYNWMTTELCVARTVKNAANLFWPDKTNSKCVLDSETPAPDLSISVYTSMADCCKEGVHWLSEKSCFMASGSSPALAATNKFFIDWETERCIQNTEGTSKSPLRWDDVFDTLSECCSRLPWVSSEDCSGPINEQ